MPEWVYSIEFKYGKDGTQVARIYIFWDLTKCWLFSIATPVFGRVRGAFIISLFSLLLILRKHLLPCLLACLLVCLLACLLVCLFACLPLFLLFLFDTLGYGLCTWGWDTHMRREKKAPHFSPSPTPHWYSYILHPPPPYLEGDNGYGMAFGLVCCLYTVWRVKNAVV